MLKLKNNMEVINMAWDEDEYDDDSDYDDDRDDED